MMYNAVYPAWPSWLNGGTEDPVVWRTSRLFQGRFKVNEWSAHNDIWDDNICDYILGEIEEVQKL